MRTLGRRVVALSVCAALVLTNAPLRLVHPAVLPLAEPGVASADPGPTTTRISVSSAGAQGNGNSTLSLAGGVSTAGGVSADGRFAVFESSATNLAPNDLNGRTDVFLRDLELGTTSLLSVNVLGLPGNGDSTWPSISDDGRFIAFASEASDLVAADANFTTDVFVRDRVAGTTTLASVSLSGTSGSGRSRNPMISADGRLVVFDSRATDLVPGVGGVTNIFVRDLVAGTTRRVSSAPDGSQANGNNILPYISPDGRFVTFASSATNLGIDLGGVDPTRHQQVYLRDLQTGTLELISVTTSGKGATGGNQAGPISADGRFVVFISGGGDVLPGTCCGSLYLRDRVAQSTSRINGGGGPFPHMSPDARFVLFGSVSALRPEDTNVTFDVYLLDRFDGSLALVSLTPAGAAGGGNSFPAAISPDGRFAEFYSSAADLVQNDTNGFQDVFLRDFGSRGDFGTGVPFTFGTDPNGAYSPDPVNLATGSLTAHADDLLMPGRVLGLAFTRWYNSADLLSGPLGPGWTHSYHWKLTDNTSTVEVRRGDGRRDLFTRNADGTYADPPGVFDTLTKNADGTFTLTLASQVQYEFSAAGQLSRIHEPAGNQITLGYTAGNLTQLTDTVGRSVALSYDAANRLSQLQDPLGRRVTYAYDANGRLATVTDRIGNGTGPAAAHQWRYAYDGTTSHLATITDPDGRVRVTNSYGAQGRVVEQRDGLGALTTMSYASGQTVLTDPRGHQTTYTFDSRMRVLSQSDPVGAATYTIGYTYDAVGNRTSVTDRNGNRTDFAYDVRGNLLSKTDPSPDGIAPRPVTSFAYDAKNNLTQVTDALGFITSLAYDPTTNVLLSVSRQIDATTSAKTTYDYADPLNQGVPTRVTAPRGNTGATPDPTFSTTLVYDAQANLVRRTDANGAITTFAYDAVGRLVSLVDPDGNAAGATPADHTWRATYDELDRETSRTNPLGSILSYAYDGAGNRTSLTDRNGNVTTWTYDGNARLASIQQKPNPAGAAVHVNQVTRDPNGNATRLTQANAVATDYAYDALNRVVAISTSPTATALTTSYVLDGNGQPTTRTTGDGVTVSYAYDNLSRPTSVVGPALSISYAYDPLGQRTRMADATGLTTYRYDGLGRLTQAAAPNGTLAYSYDLDGNRSRLTYPNADAVSYAYSPGGRLSTVTDWANRASRYSFQASGLVSTVTYPNAMVASYGYDQAQRLVAVTYSRGGVVGSERYTLDPEGNRTGLTDLFGTTPEVAGTLRYDGLERLTSFERHVVATGAPVSNETFSFDPASNITARTGPAASFSYDGANRITSDGMRSFVWDGADRLVGRGADSFSYDALSRLTSSSVAGVVRGYTYDGDGLLGSRTQGATTTSFLYDPAFAPAPLLVAGTERIVYGLGPLYREHAGATYDTLVRDGIGSVRLEVSGTGRITNAFDYTAYGALNASTAQPLLGFAGEMHDASGLLYLRARWYDPAVGRFMTKDPVSGASENPMTLNRYLYAGASPALNTDPTGLCTGGGSVIYCIERWIPTAIACPPQGPLCGTGDNRFWPNPYAGTFKVQTLVRANGHIDTDVGYSQATLRNGLPITPPLKGSLSDCGGSFGHESILLSCIAYNAFKNVPGSPGPIQTRVEILISGGRPIVHASGTLYPSLAVYKYGSEGPQLLYFYDGTSAGLDGLSSQGNLPSIFGGK
jgi:RHS repeat-associated protein